MAKYTWDHVHLRTPNPEATAQWYERMLGAEVIRSMQQGQPRIDLKLGGANIFIAPVAPGDGVNPPLAFAIVVDQTGTWVISGIDASGLADGTITYSVTATDAVGNVAEAEITAQKDTSAGPLALMDDPEDDDDEALLAVASALAASGDDPGAVDLALAAEDEWLL